MVAIMAPCPEFMELMVDAGWADHLPGQGPEPAPVVEARPPGVIGAMPPDICNDLRGAPVPEADTAAPAPERDPFRVSSRNDPKKLASAVCRASTTAITRC